jgi:phosphoesterase, MJ0936 family
MQLLVASDIHGSLFYGQKLIDRFEEGRYKELILLGDLYYHGPRNPLAEGYDPMALSKLLNKYADRIVAIKGNCDSEIDETISDFKLLPTTTADYGGLKLTLTHGHVYNEDNIPENVGDALLYGHFHEGFIKRKGRLVVANPGSTTLPKNNTPRSYISIDAEKKIIRLHELETGKILQEALIETKR